MKGEHYTKKRTFSALGPEQMHKLHTYEASPAHIHFMNNVIAGF